MIDWYSVAVSVLWITGLAVLLATFSSAYWRSGAERTSWRRALAVPSFRLALTVGIVLFALGMVFTVEAWWERIGWVAVLVLAAWEGIAAWRARHTETKGG